MRLLSEKAAKSFTAAEALGYERVIVLAKARSDIPSDFAAVADAVLELPLPEPRHMIAAVHLCLGQRCSLAEAETIRIGEELKQEQPNLKRLRKLVATLKSNATYMQMALDDYVTERNLRELGPDGRPPDAPTNQIPIEHVMPDD